MAELKVYTLEQAAAIVQVSQRTLRGYLQTGKLKGAKMGASWRILEESLREFLESGADIIEENRSPEKRGTPISARGSHLPHTGNNGGGRRKKSSSDTAEVDK